MSASECTKELTIDSTLWTDPKRIINFAFMRKKDAYNLIKNAVILGEKGTL